jgi:hypothetical protein
MPPKIPLSGRDLGLLRRRSTWVNLGLDLGWRLDGRRPAPVALSWPLPVEASRIRIRWPARYGWQSAARLVGPYVDGLQALVELERTAIAQPGGNIVVFEFELDGVAFPVALDYEDRPVLHETVDEYPLYLKLEHLREGYGRDHVVPGGYVSNRPELYRHFHRLRRYGLQRPPVYDVYGRFSLKYSPEVRKRALDVLEAQRAFSFEGGLELLVWSEYMRQVTRARVCLDLPGRGPFSCRFIEYLAVGACVIGPEHRTMLHVPLEDGVHVTFVRDDFSDLVEAAEGLLGDEERRHRLSRGAADYFDRYLRPEQLASYCLDRCVGVARTL